MEAPISLRPITQDNLDQVIGLELHDHQRGALAENVYSIAQASVIARLRCRAVYEGDTVVGFLMYAHPDPDDDEAGCYGIWRFMIDRKHQRRGLGKRALLLLVRQLRSQPDARKIVITYLVSNDVAKLFYQGVGFEEVGVDPDSGEMDAVLLAQT